MSSFDASATAIGFLHQLRWAFLELLRAARTDQTVRVSLEVFDDVAVEDGQGNPLKAIQLKHRDPNYALTNSSADLWKTLRVWLATPALRDADGPQLFLVTTGTAAPGSIADKLGVDPQTRNPVFACDELTEIAVKSTTQATEKARSAWLEADVSVRLDLLKRVTVVTESAPVGEIDDLLEQELRLTVRPEHMAFYVERLWGWWDSRCVAMLRGDSPIADTSALEVFNKLQEVRDDFTRDSLPLDLSLVDITDEDIEGHSEKTFVKQLQWIDIHGSNLKYAMINFHRAYTQTAVWLRDADLFNDDIERYQNELLEEWRVHFEDMCDDLRSEGLDSEDSKAQAGKKLFRFLRDSNEVHIRKNFTEAFYIKGSRHMIADRGELGWHPDFEDRVKKLLLSDEVAA